MTQRKLALSTGWALVLMAVIAGFCIGYALQTFNQPETVASAGPLLQAQKGLYVSMLFGLSVVVVLDLMVSYTLFKFFEQNNRQVSIYSAGLRIIYTLIFSVAIYQLVRNVSTVEITNQAIQRNFDMFQTIWNGGLVIFGMHLLLIGYLMKLHQAIPRFLWVLTFFAGASYLVVHALKFALEDASFVSTLEMVLALPMALGELGLALWLIVKGAKNH